MIRLPDPPARLRFETLLPLIDVVFFLVIAFMMVSHLKTPQPFAVTPPESVQRRASDATFTLFVSPDGVPGFVADRPLTGEAALARLAVARAAHCATADCLQNPPALRLSADAGTPGPGLAALLPVLAGMGFGQVDMVATGG